MPPPRSVDPLEALELVTRHLRVCHPLEVDVAEARGLFLAEPIDGLGDGAGFPGDDRDCCRAAIDGYALPRDCGVGDELEIVDDRENPSKPLEAAPLPGRTARVERGVQLPESVRSIVPVADTTILGIDRVRIDQLAEDGEGLVGGRRVGLPRRHPVGSVVDGRLQAFLLACGQRKVAVRPRPRIGVISFGDELCDLSVEADRSTGQLPDIGGYWIGGALRDLGAEVVDFGVQPDDPAAFWRTLLACRTRQLSFLVVCGGLGDGISDRTAESIREAQGDVLFDRVDAHGAPHALFAKCSEMDVLGLSGAPLDTACGFDLFVRPAIFARLGARTEIWDWRQRQLPHSTSGVRIVRDGGRDWAIQAAQRRVSAGPKAGENPHVHSWDPESRFSPIAAGATGWVIFRADSEDGRAHYVPLSLTGPEAGL